MGAISNASPAPSPSCCPARPSSYPTRPGMPWRPSPTRAAAWACWPRTAWCWPRRSASRQRCALGLQHMCSGLGAPLLAAEQRITSKVEGGGQQGVLRTVDGGRADERMPGPEVGLGSEPPRRSSSLVALCSCSADALTHVQPVCPLHHPAAAGHAGGGRAAREDVSGRAAGLGRAAGEGGRQQQLGFRGCKPGAAAAQWQPQQQQQQPPQPAAGERSIIIPTPPPRHPGTARRYRLDDHIACAVAGITADANILVNSCRLQAQRYLLTYQVGRGGAALARCAWGGECWDAAAHRIVDPPHLCATCSHAHPPLPPRPAPSTTQPVQPRSSSPSTSWRISAPPGPLKHCFLSCNSTPAAGAHPGGPAGARAVRPEAGVHAVRRAAPLWRLAAVRGLGRGARLPAVPVRPLGCARF